MAERVTMAEKTRAAEMRAAAAAEGAGFGDPTRAHSSGNARRSAPRGVSMARSLAFPGQVRAKLETRNGKEWYHLEGHASVTDTPYEMWDWYGPYDEIVDSGAFDITLSNEPDVMYLVNHRGLGMARTTNDTLTLEMDDTGLMTHAWVNPQRQDVKDLILAIDDKTITEMSFAFMLVEGWWSDDFMTFKITETDLDRGDVSAVNYGANPYTDVSARQREIMADVERLPAHAQRAVWRGLSRQFRDVESVALALAGVTDAAASTGPQIRSQPADIANAETRIAHGSPQGRSIATVEAMLLD